MGEPPGIKIEKDVSQPTNQPQSIHYGPVCKSRKPHAAVGPKFPISSKHQTRQLVIKTLFRHSTCRGPGIMKNKSNIKQTEATHPLATDANIRRREMNIILCKHIKPITGNIVAPIRANDCFFYKPPDLPKFQKKKKTDKENKIGLSRFNKHNGYLSISILPES